MVCNDQQKNQSTSNKNQNASIDMNIKKSYIFIEKTRDEMTLVFESMANVDVIKPREMPYILMSSEHFEAISLRDIYEY